MSRPKRTVRLAKFWAGEPYGCGFWALPNRKVGRFGAARTVRLGILGL
jgi:hypothetical protein